MAKTVKKKPLAQETVGSAEAAAVDDTPTEKAPAEAAVNNVEDPLIPLPVRLLLFTVTRTVIRRREESLSTEVETTLTNVYHVASAAEATEVGWILLNKKTPEFSLAYIEILVNVDGRTKIVAFPEDTRYRESIYSEVIDAVYELGKFAYSGQPVAHVPLSFYLTRHGGLLGKTINTATIGD